MSSLREIIATFVVDFDDTKLKKGSESIESAIGTLKAFGAALAGSAIVVGIANMTRELVNQAGALADQSQALGLSTRELQEWNHAAKMSGVESGDLAASMMRVQKSAADAAAGAGPAADAWKRLGVSVKNADGSLKGTNALFGEAAVALGAVQNSTEKTALSMDIFGKSGAKLIPLFNQGADGIAALKGEVEALGGGLGDTKGFEELGDNLDRWDLAFTSLKAVVGNAVLPMLNRLAIYAAKGAAVVSKLAKNSNILESGFLVAGAAVAWFGRQSLIAAGKALLPFLPAIAVIGGLILLVDELITTFKGGDSLIRRAIDRMFGDGSTAKVVEWFKNAGSNLKEWLSKAVATFKEIVGAFKSDGVEGLKKLFPEVSDAWWSVMSGMVSVASFAAGAIVEAFSGNFDRITALGDYLVMWFEAFALELVAPFTEAAGMITDTFTSTWNSVIEGAQGAVRAIADALSSIPGVEGIAKDALKTLGGAKVEGAGGAFSEAQRQNDVHRLDIASRMNTATRRMAGGSTTNNSAPVINNNFTLPPGSTADTARQARAAASMGTKQGLRAAKHALVQQGT